MNINIWTTNKCNLNCTYCYEKSNRQKGTDNTTIMTTNNVIKWISSIANKYESINFHGGEPLLNYKIIIYITDFLKKKEILPKKMGMTTNGTVWNEELKRYFQKYRDLYMYDMSISIDGTEKSHNTTRIALDHTNSYKEMIETKKELMNIFPYLRARMTVTTDNVTNLYENVRHVAELGFNSIAPVLDIYDKSWNEDGMACLKEEMLKIIDYWRKNKYINIAFINEILYRRPKSKCQFSYNISVEGDIYPCIDAVGREEFCIGNVRDGIRTGIVNELYHMVDSDYEFCKSCTNVRYCDNNRCKFINYVVEKSNDIPSKVGCRFEALKYEVSKYL